MKRYDWGRISQETTSCGEPWVMIQNNKIDAARKIERRDARW